MDLDNKIGRNILFQRQDRLESELLKLLAAYAEQKADCKKLLEINRLHRPHDLTLRLLTGRGYTRFAGKTISPQDKRNQDFEISEKFLLRSTEVIIENNAKLASLNLIISAMAQEANTGSRKLSAPYKLSISIHVPDEPTTVHYLTHISKPLIGANEMPEGYGMLTYSTDGYETQSHVPSEEESAFIIAALEEAAELAGIRNIGQSEYESRLH